MNDGRTNLRELAALSSVVREIVDGIKAVGHPPVAAQEAALDAVDAFIRGAKLTKAEAKRLSKASVDEVRAFGVSSPPAEKAASSVSAPVGRLLVMAARGDDDTAETLTYAGYALGSLHGLSWEAYSRRIKESFAKALEAHAHLSDAPLAEKAARVDAKKGALESDLLAKSRAALPPYGQELLDRIGAERDAKRIGTPDELRAMLAKHDYPAWDVVMRFNEDLGGLLIPDTDAKHWREDSIYSLAGPYAGLAAGGDRMRCEGLVPVYFGASDMIGFLDEKGEAWLGGVLDGQLTALHCTGAELVATCIAFDLLQTGGRKLKGLVNKAGLEGEKIAEALGLPKIASYGPARMWASGDAVVNELQGTQLGALTDEAWTKMQSVLAALDPSAADLFEAATKERTLPNVERAFAALVAAIPGCESLADVKHLFSPYVLAALQTDDGEPRWRKVASALIERAASMKPDEGGRTLGWVARQGAQQLQLQGWEDPSLRRRAWCEGIDEQLDLLRRWVTDESPVRRAAAAYAFGWCRSARKEDVALLLGGLGGEKDVEALATQLLVVGWLARSTGADRASALKALRGVATTNPLVATCAVAGLVWLGEPLRHKEVDVLFRQLRRSAKLPALWHLDDYEAPADTRTLAWHPLRTMKVAEPEQTIAAARAMLAEPKLPRFVPQGVKVALARAAFDGQRPVPREGVALEDLSTHDREVLSILLDGPFNGTALGLDEYPLRRLVEQTLPEWRPLEIVAGGTTRHWHFARIVGAVGVGQVEADVGRDAVIAALTATEAAKVVNSRSKQFWLIEGAMTADERHRALSMCLEILDAAEAAGVDINALCRNYLESSSWGALTLWSIREHDGRPPEDHYPLLDAAMTQPDWHLELLSAIRGLPADVRAKVFQLAFPSRLEFWEPLDEVTVPRLVLMAAEHPKRIAEVIALLEKGGPNALSLAESVTSTNPKVEVNLAFVRDALQKARRT